MVEKDRYDVIKYYVDINMKKFNKRDACREMLEQTLRHGFKGFTKYSNEELADLWEQATGEKVKVVGTIPN